ncbi:MAG TPA: SHOCT domain-containing protein [Anaerolineae bacterium]|nr:SHOCT domain-containing protein [Anaerolineae bacterium]
MMGGMGIGFGLFGVLLMFLFLAGLVALVVWLGRLLFGNIGHTTTSGPAGVHAPTAHEILDQRYARGELTREEYQRIGLDLQASEEPR